MDSIKGLYKKITFQKHFSQIFVKETTPISILYTNKKFVLGDMIGCFWKSLGQVAIFSLPCWVVAGGHKIHVGTDRVLKGSVFDWYQTL